MIGDRAVDVQSARANGLRSIAVAWGFGGQEEISNAGATFVAKTLSELVEIVVQTCPT